LDSQDRLHQEIREVCGSEKITEEHLQRLPYLNAVFHETLRYHSPVPIIPPRYVHEDTTLGGYKVPAGTDVSFGWSFLGFSIYSFGLFLLGFIFLQKELKPSWTFRILVEQ